MVILIIILIKTIQFIVCCSSFFGALEYFFNIYIYITQKDIKLTQKAYNLLLAEIKSNYYYRAIEKRILENVKFI